MFELLKINCNFRFILIILIDESILKCGEFHWIIVNLDTLDHV